MRNHALPAQISGPRVHASADIVIVGNGIAGLTAAVEARRFAPEKTIILLTEQCHPTINTPALKQFITGKVRREQLLAYPTGTEEERGLKVVQARVEEIDAYGQCLRLAGGGRVHYGSLLLATGSVANGLPGPLPGSDLDGLLVLHRMRDYLDLRRRLGEVAEVAVIGGGIHGAETVMGLLQAGKKVHWLLRGKTCLPRLLNPAAAEMLMRYVEEEGGRIYPQTETVGFVGHVGAVAGVATNQNRVIPCELALVCTGMQPAVELAERCNLPLIHERGRGILVDDQLRTSVPHIFAAGDVAACRNPQSGAYQAQPRWYAAVVQGRAAAATLTEQFPVNIAELLGVPWHATRLGRLSVLTIGNPLGGSGRVTVLTESGRSGYRRIALQDERLVGYLSLSQKQPDALAIKRLIDEALPVRDIKEALLKGTFDAREYFAHLRSSAVYSLAARGRPVPPPAPPDRPPSLVGIDPLTPPYDTEPFPPRNVSRRRPQTEPLRELRSAHIPAHSGGTLNGSRPPAPGANPDTRSARQSALSDASLPSSVRAGQAPSPSSSLAGQAPPTSVASPQTPVVPLLVSLPASGRPERSRSLWSYDTKSVGALAPPRPPVDPSSSAPTKGCGSRPQL